MRSAVGHMVEPIKILLVDDQSLYREGLVELFKKWDDFRVVGDVACGVDAVSECGVLRPDIVLMDVKMPGMDGIEACGEICLRYPAAVVMLSLYGDKGRVLSAISNGAKGYLLKNIHANELRQKLLSVAKGDAALSDEVAAVCLDALRGPKFAPLDEAKVERLISSLTEHEIELLKFIAHGASNKDIASKLFIGEGTVKKHVSLMLAKLHLENRVQAAVFALRSGIAR